MSKIFPAPLLLLCTMLVPAHAGETVKTSTMAVSIDPNASAYQAHLHPLLEAPLQIQAPSTAHAVAEMLRTLAPLADPGLPQKAAPLPPKDRGDVNWAEVYEKTAPAVVFLAGEEGFGTGFVIDAQERWVVTNHHVARAASLDGERHWGMNAYFGELGDDGVMEPTEAPLRAMVYRWDPQRDLALLKLDAPASLPRALEMADGAKKHLPKAGQDVALVGNGAVGLLWAMKPGYVASLGTLSRNLPFLLSRVNQVHGLDPSAALQPGVLERLQEEVGRGFEGWIGGNTLLIQSTAEATQGDSGGPLVNEEAEVVGIAMGLRVDQNSASSVSYYIHVNEIRDFVAQIPEQPLLEVASSFWETRAVNFALSDVTRDGNVDLIQGFDAEHNVVMCAMDLDQDTDLESLFAETPVRSPVVAVLSVDDGTITVYENGIMIRSHGEDVAWRQQLVGRVASAALARDGAWGALGFVDGSVAVFDGASGASSWRKGLDGTPVTAMAFSGSSQSLWSGTAGGSVVEISPAGDPVRRITLQNGVLCLAASPNAQYVAAGEMRGSLRVFDATNGRELWANPDVPTYAARFTADSHNLVASPQGNVNQLYWMNSWSGEVVRELALPGSPYCFEFSGDDASVAVLLHDQARYVVCRTEDFEQIAQWDVSAPSSEFVLDRLLSGTTASNRPVEAFCFRDGKLVTGDATGMVYEVDVVGGDEGRGFHHQIVAPDLETLVASKSFDAEFAWLIDARANSCYVMYDLDNDTTFDLIRVDDAADLILDSEYRRENGALVRHDALEDQPVFLAPSRLPPPWQANYLVSMGGS